MQVPTEPAAVFGQLPGMADWQGRMERGRKKGKREAPALTVADALSTARDLPTLIVANAILGPCAANRGLGHEPGDW